MVTSPLTVAVSGNSPLATRPFFFRRILGLVTTAPRQPNPGAAGWRKNSKFLGRTENGLQTRRAVALEVEDFRVVGSFRVIGLAR
jgi:hypothetical protein